MTPNTGPFDINVVSDSVSALFDRIGPGILFTHSQGGGPGWLTAIKNQKVKAIVAFEPGSGFVFPEGEVPPPNPSAFDTVRASRAHVAVHRADEDSDPHLLRRQHPSEPMHMPAQDSWRARLEMARLWRDTVNRHGGNVTVVHLPELGIRGNTHFPFSDLNNVRSQTWSRSS